MMRAKCAIVVKKESKLPLALQPDIIQHVLVPIVWMCSLTDAEITEDMIQDVIGIDFAEDRTEFLQCLTNLDGN